MRTVRMHIIVLSLLALTVSGLNAYASTALDKRLIQAVEKGDIQEAKTCLAEGADPNTKDEQGRPVFVRAANKNNTAMMRLLIDSQADVNAKRKDGINALMISTLVGKTEVVRFLIEKGADINARDAKGSTALMVAALFGHLETARLLVEQGADVNAAGSENETVLMTAILGLPEIFSPLKKGTLPNSKADERMNALLAAGEPHRPDIIRLLIENGADINAKTDGYTPLMAAAGTGKLELTKLLLEKGADINAKDKDGKTVLDLVLKPDFTKLKKYVTEPEKLDYTKIVELLKAHGAKQ